MINSIGALSLALILLLSFPAFAQWQIDLEGGLVSSGYNDVRIPNEGGTLISLNDDLETESDLFWRARVNYRLADKHLISVFAAPLRLEATGAVNKVVSFEGTDFPALTGLTADYRFDSYRLTYRYRIYRSSDLQLGLGFTAKIRDAEVALSGGGKSASLTNTGFVPLINFALDWEFAERLHLLFAGDALAAPQGRAEDVLLAVKYEPTPKLGVKVGYRLLEGGADVDDVYNFTLLHYFVIGVVATL
jgi:hypothetical protein